MTKHIPAIPTVYKGYHFRSRLEARFAVFFDSLDLEWEYEKEGYVLGSLGGYLPDFYLPSLDYFIEIKGVVSTELERHKCERLSELADVFLFDDGLRTESVWYSSDSTPSAIWFSEGRYRDSGAKFLKCDKCGSIDITFDGWVHYSGLCKCYNDDHRNKLGSFHPDIIGALNAARSSRFEYGQSGAT